MDEKPKTSDISDSTHAGAEAEQAGEYMHPAGEDPETHEADEGLKRIDEDVDGSEETETLADVEAGDG